MKNLLPLTAILALVSGSVLAALGGSFLMQTLNDIYFFPKYIGITLLVYSILGITISLYKDFRPGKVVTRACTALLIISAVCFSVFGWYMQEEYASIKQSYIVRDQEFGEVLGLYREASLNSLAGEWACHGIT